MWHTFFDAVIMTETKTVPASSAGGVACPAKELMQRNGRFAGHLLHVCGPFEEWNTGASLFML
jgi:hypothetical protein